MKNYISYSLLSLILLFFSSCEKVVELNLGNETGKLVIEGNLTNIKGLQVIKLSTNIPFSNTNEYPPVSGAEVSVSDQNGNIFKFTESPSGTYTINNVAGIPGNTYTMKVLSAGKTYTASAVMPKIVVLDSITSEKDKFDSKERREITVHYHDLVGTTDQYRFITFVNGVQVKSVDVENDNFTNGNDVHHEVRQDDIDIYPGATVTVEMQCIDKPVYTYWFTLMRQNGAGPGGSVTPSNPPTNISPATLGYFSAHTSSVKTITVK